MGRKIVEQKILSDYLLSEVDQATAGCQLKFKCDIMSENIDEIKIGIYDFFDSQMQNVNDLNLDMTMVKMLDSIGLNFLVTIIKKMKLNGAEMSIVVSDPFVLKALTVGGIPNLVPVIEI